MWLEIEQRTRRGDTSIDLGVIRHGRRPSAKTCFGPAWTIKLGSKRFSPVLGEQHALVSGGLMCWTGWVHGALVQAQLPAKTGALGLSYLGRFTRDGDNLTRDVAGCMDLNC